MNSTPTSLTTIERDDLARYELIIERGLRSFREAGQALSEINERRLYRERYSSFEEYCLKHWHFERAHAYRLIEAAKVIANLSPVGDSLPTSEWQARPLTQLEPTEQVEAWTAARAIADDKPVAAHVQRAVDAVKQGSKTPRPGESVLVLDERSPDYGKVGQVIEANGIVVQVAVEDRVRPLLVNEVRSQGGATEAIDRPTNMVAQTPIKPTAPKNNPVTSLTAELEICEARIEILELEIDNAIALIKKFSCDRNYAELADWIKKADTLLRG